MQKLEKIKEKGLIEHEKFEKFKEWLEGNERK